MYHVCDESDKRPTAADEVACMVCLSVCLSVHRWPAKTAEPIDTAICGVDLVVCPKKPLLNGGFISPKRIGNLVGCPTH